jgi:hypothetical protein
MAIVCSMSAVLLGPLNKSQCEQQAGAKNEMR